MFFANSVCFLYLLILSLMLNLQGSVFVSILIQLFPIKPFFYCTWNIFIWCIDAYALLVNYLLGIDFLLPDTKNSVTDHASEDKR